MTSEAEKGGAEERRRAALKRAIKQFDVSPAELARKAGLKSANLLYNYLTGRSKSLSVDTVERLAKALPGENIAALLGATKYQDYRGTKPVTVAYRGRHDAFVESAFMPPERQYQIAVRGVGREGLFGVELADDSLAPALPAGSVAILQHMKNFSAEIEPGMRVCVRRVDEVFGREEIAMWTVEKGQLANGLGGVIPLKGGYRGPFKHGALVIEIIGVMISAIVNEAWLKR